mmetsp:Transcript_66799/g.168669  ORF Transcript_66799/g.168669 Transcript_66799/m.168669 type:complete len:261 (+) Transcript_66799:179-961(+)
MRSLAFGNAILRPVSLKTRFRSGFPSCTSWYRRFMRRFDFLDFKCLTPFWRRQHVPSGIHKNRAAAAELRRACRLLSLRVRSFGSLYGPMLLAPNMMMRDSSPPSSTSSPLCALPKPTILVVSEPLTKVLRAREVATAAPSNAAQAHAVTEGIPRTPAGEAEAMVRLATRGDVAIAAYGPWAAEGDKRKALPPEASEVRTPLLPGQYERSFEIVATSRKSPATATEAPGLWRLRRRDGACIASRLCLAQVFRENAAEEAT